MVAFLEASGLGAWLSKALKAVRLWSQGAYGYIPVSGFLRLWCAKTQRTKEKKRHRERKKAKQVYCTGQTRMCAVEVVRHRVSLSSAYRCLA